MRDPEGNLCFTIEIQIWKGVREMDKYVKAEMEVIEFEAEDVITTSNPPGTGGPGDIGGYA